VRLEEFDYELPPELVAQAPRPQRESARLLVHQRAAGTTAHRRVADLGEYLRPGDLLVLNDTRVLAARLFGRRASGARVEFLFCEPTGEPHVWKALCNPARKLRPGEVLLLAEGALRAVMLERPRDAEGRPALEWTVRLEELGSDAEDVLSVLDRYGTVPLPPYIHREGSEGAVVDRERYQTVYARRPGAVAAPTAGLHFTPELLASLERAGVRTARVTLHVGPGTFRPIEVDRVEEHRMHSERFELPEETVRAVEETRAGGGRVICVGTTVVRVLEAVAKEGKLHALKGRTDIYIYPGFRFRVVDGLLTNFHLPRSSLLVLVSAFAGVEKVRELYREAIEEGYRFYSYGDAMLLV